MVTEMYAMVTEISVSI